MNGDMLKEHNGSRDQAIVNSGDLKRRIVFLIGH
jgi:hypothetical protein